MAENFWRVCVGAICSFFQLVAVGISSLADGVIFLADKLTTVVVPFVYGGIRSFFQLIAAVISGLANGVAFLADKLTTVVIPFVYSGICSFFQLVALGISSLANGVVFLADKMTMVVFPCVYGGVCSFFQLVSVGISSLANGIIFLADRLTVVVFPFVYGGICSFFQLVAVGISSLANGVVFLAQKLTVVVFPFVYSGICSFFQLVAVGISSLANGVVFLAQKLTVVVIPFVYGGICSLLQLIAVGISSLATVVYSGICSFFQLVAVGISSLANGVVFLAQKLTVVVIPFVYGGICSLFKLIAVGISSLATVVYGGICSFFKLITVSISGLVYGVVYLVNEVIIAFILFVYHGICSFYKKISAVNTFSVTDRLDFSQVADHGLSCSFYQVAIDPPSLFSESCQKFVTSFFIHSLLSLAKLVTFGLIIVICSFIMCVCVIKAKERFGKWLYRYKPKKLSTPTPTTKKEHSDLGKFIEEFLSADESCVDRDHGAPFLCPDYILGECKNIAKCVDHHSPLPYEWGYYCRDEAFSMWLPFSEADNRIIEKHYCDPDCVKIELHASIFPASGNKKGNKKVIFNFESMLATLQVSPYSINTLRRLSTESYVVNSGNNLGTLWTWYWQDETNNWMTYGKGSQEESAVQQGIERAFLDKSCKFYDYDTTANCYKLHFRENPMYQKNKRYKTIKWIRRRPQMATIQQLKQSNLRLMQPFKDDKQTSLPSNWASMTDGKEFRRVKLSPGSQEFHDVEKQFRLTMPQREATLVRIERVQNPFMWEKFTRKKSKMQTKCKGTILEKKLFHGTSSALVDKICKENFDWRLCGTHGTKYGQGSYFALNASYSDNYSKSTGHNSSHFMFLANVLVGSYVEGYSTMRRPPPKNPSDPQSDLFDSTVDNQQNPSIFVVYDIDQCYPSHVIKYLRQ